MTDAGGRLALEQVGKSRRARAVEEVMLDGLAHVCVEQQHLLPRQREGDGRVVGYGGFAFAEERAGDQQGAQAAGVRRDVNGGAQRAERLGARRSADR